jgi:dissimilatory sulfite reductase related protein
MLKDDQGSNTGQTRRYRSFGGHEVLIDNEGFLWQPEDWSEELVRAMAAEEGLANLTVEHWRVIIYLRDFYCSNGRAPLNRQLKAGTGLRLQRIEELFPGGIKMGARRFAGLPNPRSCL